jgi:hypothetical protein
MKKNNPFKVPDSYFDDLENTILSQTTQNKKIISIRSLYWKYAAACLFLIGISVFMYHEVQQQKTEQAVDVYYENFIEDYSEDEMNFYVETNFEQDW